MNDTDSVLKRRKIASVIERGYFLMPGASVLINEQGHGAIVNRGGAFYWVNNPDLVREYGSEQDTPPTSQDSMLNAGNMIEGDLFWFKGVKGVGKCSLHELMCYALENGQATLGARFDVKRLVHAPDPEFRVEITKIDHETGDFEYEIIDKKTTPTERPNRHKQRLRICDSSSIDTEPTLVDAYQAIDQALFDVGKMLAPDKKREAARALLSAYQQGETQSIEQAARESLSSAPTVSKQEKKKTKAGQLEIMAAATNYGDKRIMAARGTATEEDVKHAYLNLEKCIKQQLKALT